MGGCFGVWRMWERREMGRKNTFQPFSKTRISWKAISRIFWKKGSGSMEAHRHMPRIRQDTQNRNPWMRCRLMNRSLFEKPLISHSKAARSSKNKAGKPRVAVKQKKSTEAKLKLS